MFCKAKKRPPLISKTRRNKSLPLITPKFVVLDTDFGPSYIWRDSDEVGLYLCYNYDVLLRSLEELKTKKVSVRVILVCSIISFLYKENLSTAE